MTQSLAQTIATEVRAEMGRQRVSGRQLTKVLGLSQAQMSKRLLGQIEFRPNELQKIADHFGVPVIRFFPDGVEPPVEPPVTAPVEAAS